MDSCNIPNRNLVKEYTYKVLFGRNGTNSKADKIFSSLFPTIHHFIKLYKKENDDYKVYFTKIMLFTRLPYRNNVFLWWYVSCTCNNLR